MATQFPFEPYELGGPPSLVNLPTLTEEVVMDATNSVLPEPDSQLPIDAQQANEAAQTPLTKVIDPARLEALLAKTVDEAVATALQQALPRFIAQVRTQVAATVQRRLREEIEKKL